MKRRIFNVVAVVSLIIGAIFLLLKVRSYWRADYVAYCGQNAEFGVISSGGRTIIYDESTIEPFSWRAPFGLQWDTRPAPASISAYALPNSSRQVNWMGFGAMSGDNGRYRATARFVPHWAVAMTSLIVQFVWVRRVRKGRAQRGFRVLASSDCLEHKSGERTH